MGRLVAEKNIRADLERILDEEVGTTGRFILKKQCANLGISLENLKAGDLPLISDKIFDVINNYLGHKRAYEIRKKMLEYEGKL